MSEPERSVAPGTPSRGRVVVFQHVACEGPGTLVDVLGAAGVPWECRRLCAGDAVPSSLEGISGLVILGGPMSVNDGDRISFLAPEENLVREAIRLDLPTVGICLGSQLIAKAAGARVRNGPSPEIGWMEVRLDREAGDDRLLGGLPSPLPVFQWHAETFDLPVGAVPLASSEAYPHQAFRLGRNVHAFQFHLEVVAWMVEQWCRVYAGELTEATSQALLSDLFAKALALRSLSKKVFGAFAESVRRRGEA